MDRGARGLQSMGSHRVRHNRTTNTLTFSSSLKHYFPNRYEHISSLETYIIRIDLLFPK